MGVSADEIARVQVGGYRATLEVAGIAEPATASEARFSTPYLVATALTHGSVRLAAFEPPRLEDAGTRALMKRVELALDRVTRRHDEGVVDRTGRLGETAKGPLAEHFAARRVDRDDASRVAVLAQEA